MAKQNPKNKKQDDSQTSGKSVKVSDKLGEFDIVIDSFGKIHSNYDVDKINEFLNENVDDKKLRNRDDLKKNSRESAEE